MCICKLFNGNNRWTHFYTLRVLTCNVKRGKTKVQVMYLEKYYVFLCLDKSK